MKKILFLSLIVLLTISTSAQDKKYPIEGAWQMVYASSVNNPFSFPAQYKGGQIKMFSKDYFTFVGHFILGTMKSENYGGGKYKLEGNRYEEEIIYHADTSSVGKKIRLIVEIRNDTLVQKWPADENWNIIKVYNTEKYVRLK